MPTNDNTDTSRPKALQTISDADKAVAISSVCKALTGQSVDARIEMTDYNGRLDLRGPFRHYSGIRFALFAKENGVSPEELVDALQQIDDETLASAIAAKLGKLAGEDYQGYISLKRIASRPKTGSPIASVGIQIAVA